MVHLPPYYLFYTKSFYYTPTPALLGESSGFEVWRMVAGNELRPSEMGIHLLLKGSSQVSRTELTQKYAKLTQESSPVPEFL